MYLAPIKLPHWGMYLTPIILQHLDILRQLQHLSIVFAQMMSLNKGAVHKE